MKVEKKVTELVEEKIAEIGRPDLFLVEVKLHANGKLIILVDGDNLVVADGVGQIVDERSDSAATWRICRHKNDAIAGWLGRARYSFTDPTRFGCMRTTIYVGRSVRFVRPGGCCHVVTRNLRDYVDGRSGPCPQAISSRSSTAIMSNSTSITLCSIIDDERVGADRSRPHPIELSDYCVSSKSTSSHDERCASPTQ